jgi:hypothetical protein
MLVADVEEMHRSKLGVMTATVRAKFAAMLPFQDSEAPYLCDGAVTSYHDLLGALVALRKRRETRPGGSADPYAQGWPSVEARARDHWGKLTDEGKATVARRLGWDPRTQGRQWRPLDWYDLADLACYQWILQQAFTSEDRGEATAEIGKVRELIDEIAHRKAEA